MVTFPFERRGKRSVHFILVSRFAKFYQDKLIGGPDGNQVVIKFAF